MKQETVFDLFKHSLKTMLKSGEFKKEYQNKNRVKVITEKLDRIERSFEGGIDGMPIVPLITIIDDAEVWQNVLIYMMLAEYQEGTDD